MKNQLLNKEDLAVYTEAFQKTGFTPAINWYRNLTRNWEQARKRHSFHIPHPCLMISAADDVVLTPEMTNGMEQHIPNLEKHTIPNCGHWTQQEQPNTLNQLITNWLKKQFGP